MSLSAYELLQHIQDEVTYLLDSSDNLTFNSFTKNETLIRAYSRSLEIIGEASKKVPTSFKRKYKEVEWKGMAGLRDKLIHDYFGIDLEIVWDIIETKIPDLERQLKKIFDDFNQE